jgi:hypothetical protein
MHDWLVIIIGAGVAIVLLGNILAFFRSRPLRQFLKEIARPVGKDYFDFHSDKASSKIYYGNSFVTGTSVVSSDGIYLESVFKFYVVIPWKAIYSIRAITVNGQRVANLRIGTGKELNRQLVIPWSSKFQVHIPEAVIFIDG